MNVCIFSGRIGQDPQAGQLSNGDPKLSFSVAVQTGRKDNPSTMWIRCTMFGRRAQALETMLAKGMKVSVSGSIKLDEYQAKDGTPKQALSMVVNDIELMGDPAEKRQAAKPAFGDDDIGF
jgi:single-strand DNA-binding protein